MSGALGDDTVRTLASGRQAIGSMLSAAQTHLQYLFIIFVVGFLGTFWALRAYVWEKLERDLVFRHMEEHVARDTEIVAITPFEVILLQVKVGLIVGVLITLPALIWLSRSKLKERGRWPQAGVARWKAVLFIITITLLFFGGLSYAYYLFFPIMFDFLASNAINAGFKATWSISMWFEFVLFLGLSFGLAAQLPLAMSAAARIGFVSYETFRDKWRYAVLAIFVFGAMFSPPDPFTQFMWGVPLVGLYFVSLGITKLAVVSKQASESVPMSTVVTEHWNKLAGVAVLVFAGVYFFLLEGGPAATNDLLESIGSDYRVAEGGDIGISGLSPTIVASLAGVIIAAVVILQLIFYFRMVELEKRTQEAQERVVEASTKQPKDVRPGEAAEVDLGSMNARAIQGMSAEAFLELNEEHALQHAQQAVDDENPEKAKAIFAKFDEAAEIREEREAKEADEEDDGNIVTSTAAGIVDPFTEDETDEDDIGGYYYDIQFIIESLTSKTIWLVGTFMVVLAGSFMWMYTGGIGYLRDQFFQSMPAEAADNADIVVLHPVEALIFMLKTSTVLAFLSVLPLLLYFAWPAIENRGLATGNRNVLLIWGATMVVALTGGTLLGFFYIAPSIISLLAWDVVTSNMIIAYRISSFGWLVIYLTVFIGVLAMIPATMLLFHHGSIISYARMRKSWRGVVLAFFALAGFFSPSGIFTMFIVAIPAGLAYGLGLGLLWIYELVGSKTPRSAKEPAD